jgi:U32 family peptidase
MMNKPELLAPAGTLEAVEAVLDAGADAIYISGKALNMRQHRASYNFDEDQAETAIDLAHQRQKKLYFTLNSLIFETDLDTLRHVLAWAGRACPDALIVQDLAVASLAREICVHVPLHASTMMNVHNAETAQALKMMGFSRIIASRDIPLQNMTDIAEASRLEIECFVHGDMCIAQGAQCYLSGIAFGESANCGRCMKPCRWDWKLVSACDSSGFDGPDKGYLLARKDLCMLSHIPELVEHGMASLKIEGRMRTAEFLAPIIRLYRQALDAYMTDPAHNSPDNQALQEIRDRRVRDYTTAHMFGRPGLEGINPSGQREPRFFSQAGPKPRLTLDRDLPARPITGPTELIVHVSGIDAAQTALKAGADAVYLNADGLLPHTDDFAFESVENLLDSFLVQGKRLAVLLPAITDQQNLKEWLPRLEDLADLDGLTIGVSNLGALHLAHELRFRDILANVGFNVANHVAVDELSTLGVTRVTAAIEMSLMQLTELLTKARLPVEVLVQGPLPGMLLEHCVLATARNALGPEACGRPCLAGPTVLEDTGGHLYPLICDRRCRNHLYTATDVCILPNLVRMLTSEVCRLRLECQLDVAETVGTVVGIYREALDAVTKGQAPEVSDLVQQITKVTGRPLSDGPFDFKTFIRRKERDLVRR